MAALGEAIIQIWRQHSLQNRPKLEIVLIQNIAKPMLFLSFGSFFTCGGRKTEKLQQPMAERERAGDTLEMRLRELRRLQTRQKGGSGLLKELPRLLPKVTRDIGGTAFGRLGGGNSPNLEAT